MEAVSELFPRLHQYARAVGCRRCAGVQQRVASSRAESAAQAKCEAARNAYVPMHGWIRHFTVFKLTSKCANLCAKSAEIVLLV